MLFLFTINSKHLKAQSAFHHSVCHPPNLFAIPLFRIFDLLLPIESIGLFQFVYDFLLGFAGTSGGDLFELSLRGPMQAQSYVTDYGNGTYQASYLCSQRGNYRLRVTLNGVNVGVMTQSGKLRPSPVGELQCVEKVLYCNTVSLQPHSALTLTSFGISDDL